jgi:hypothetical protein
MNFISFLRGSALNGHGNLCHAQNQAQGLIHRLLGGCLQFGRARTVTGAVLAVGFLSCAARVGGRRYNLSMRSPLVIAYVLHEFPVITIALLDHPVTYGVDFSDNWILIETTIHFPRTPPESRSKAANNRDP